MQKKVPLLLTMDLEWAPDHDAPGQTEILHEVHHTLQTLGMPATVFTTANAACRFSTAVKQFQASGHEIACHGLTHAPDEDFTRMNEADIDRCLRDSTRQIEAVTGAVPRCFRGPRMTTSRATQERLIRMGYLADFSVCPQRLDVLTCAGASAGWITAPRVPYRPSSASPFRRGNLPLWVIPLSGFGLPFLSGTMYLLGITVMRALFRGLVLEARRFGNPIVYLFHSYEFTRYIGGDDMACRPLHHRLYSSDPEHRLQQHKSLWQHMLQSGDVAPLPASQYIKDYLNECRMG